MRFLLNVIIFIINFIEIIILVGSIYAKQT